jgi:hypothetical protein
VSEMNYIFRVLIFVLGLILLKMSGRSLLYLFMGIVPPSVILFFVLVVFFVVACVSLFVAFGESYFKSEVLVAFVFVGLGALLSSYEYSSCEGAILAGVGYEPYYCSHKEMRWLMSGLLMIFLLIVVRRKFVGRL